MAEPERYDLVVVGAGSGGLGAALAAGRRGLRVLLVERAATVGGNAVHGGVHIWEPGVGGTGLPFDIYRRLKQRDRAVGLYTLGRHVCADDPALRDYPGGESRLDPSRRYTDSLLRCGGSGPGYPYRLFRQQLHGVVFEPDDYVAVVDAMLAEAGVEVARQTSFRAVEVGAGVVHSLALSDGREVAGATVVDATADAWLAEAAGCELVLGEEGRSTYGEPSAPNQPSQRLNAVTLVYRVSPVAAPAVEPLPGDVPEACWWQASFPSASITECPRGDLNINMLPTMAGAEAWGLDRETAMAECRRRVLAHWRHLQTGWPEFAGCRLSWIAPVLGVRESRRLRAECVLTQHDLLAGLSGQTHADIVTLADHAMDTHGAGGVAGELREPYGVPFRCLVPRGWGNLLVACRAAGFSSIAASSCRLSRTMMQLGQSAGLAAALATAAGTTAVEVPAAALRAALAADGVTLSWPTESAVQARLADE